MQPYWSEDAECYRRKIRDFLDAQLPPGWRGIGALDAEQREKFVSEWRGVLHANRLLALSWPEEYGGAGLSLAEQVIVAEEFARAGVPADGGVFDTFGLHMIGNTIMRWGTTDQKERFLPRILSGEDLWCQGFSEPDAGSDLAGLRCRARLDGGQWVIDGQKTWTSAGHLADWIFLLARTDPTAPPHAGITFLLVPMRQPGIEVRPIVSMTGASEFNEVFFSGAHTDAGNVLGEVNGGWAVAMTLLSYERGDMAAVLPIEFRSEFDRLVGLAQERGVSADPLVRDELARCYTRVEIMRWLGMRVLTKSLAGEHPGADASVSKLFWSEYHQYATALAVRVLGADAAAPSGWHRAPNTYRADDVGAPNSPASWVDTFMISRAETIYAGTSEVQRNIIAERVLGLPRPPRPG